MDKLAFLKRAKDYDILISAMESAAERDKAIFVKLGRQTAPSQMDHLPELLAIREEVRGAIDTIDDPSIRGIMIYRFLDYLSEDEIAERTHYCKRTVQRKIAKGIEKMSLNVAEE